MLSYLEGGDSERAIAWRVADSLTLRALLGYELTEPTPDHCDACGDPSAASCRATPGGVQLDPGALAKEGLLKGKTVGVNTTSLEENAALHNIVSRDTGQAYREYLEQLAKA